MTDCPGLPERGLRAFSMAMSSAHDGGLVGENTARSCSMPFGPPDNSPESDAFRPSHRSPPPRGARARVARLSAIALAALLALPLAMLPQPAAAAPGKNPWQRVHGTPPRTSKHGHKPDMKAKRLA